MIISASRRTDIPAYYSNWFSNRIRSGYCTVINPLFKNQISLVSLRPKDIDVIVFWTRNPKPLFNFLPELDDLGLQYYFQFTINGLIKKYEQYNPSINSSVENFYFLANKLGPGKVIWRYDPILLTDDLTTDFHINNFKRIAQKLNGQTKKVVISIVDDYKKTVKRLSELNVNYVKRQESFNSIEYLLGHITEIASRYNLVVESCAEAKDYGHLGIMHGKCIDDQLLLNEFGINLKYKKDASQRLACGCTESRDIGSNDTCLMGCVYCYATTNHNLAIKNMNQHDPEFSSILRHPIDEVLQKKINDFLLFNSSDNSTQLEFF